MIVDAQVNIIKIPELPIVQNMNVTILAEPVLVKPTLIVILVMILLIENSKMDNVFQLINIMMMVSLLKLKNVYTNVNPVVKN